jgi:hypothetical protein
MGNMSNHNSGFRSQAEREREEALCCRYGRIGIPAVAAAKSAERHYRLPEGGESAENEWKQNPAFAPEG